MFSDESGIKLKDSDIKITRETNPKCLEMKQYTSKQPMSKRKVIVRER